MVENFKLGDGYLMPNALKLPETVTETAVEVITSGNYGHLPLWGSLIISVSSGTIAAGVLKGLAELNSLDDFEVYLHMGYSRSVVALKDYMESCTGFPLGDKVHFIDEGYSYAQPAKLAEPVPFPCNPYYDAKAWKWLQKSIHTLAEPVLFYNVGE
jgi:hypothetical protein